MSVIIIPYIQRENEADHTAGTQANHEMSPPPTDWNVTLCDSGKFM